MSEREDGKEMRGRKDREEVRKEGGGRKEGGRGS